MENINFTDKVVSLDNLVMNVEIPIFILIITLIFIVIIIAIIIVSAIVAAIIIIITSEVSIIVVKFVAKEQYFSLHFIQLVKNLYLINGNWILHFIMINFLIFCC